MLLAPVFVVYAFAAVKIDEFAVLGVYSKREDADAAAEAIQPQLKNKALVVSRSMSDVMDELALARIDGLGLKLEIAPADPD